MVRCARYRLMVSDSDYKVRPFCIVCRDRFTLCRLGLWMWNSRGGRLGLQGRIQDFGKGGSGYLLSTKLCTDNPMNLKVSQWWPTQVKGRFHETTKINQIDHRCIQIDRWVKQTCRHRPMDLAPFWRTTNVYILNLVSSRCGFFV